MTHNVWCAIKANQTKNLFLFFLWWLFDDTSRSSNDGAMRKSVVFLEKEETFWFTFLEVHSGLRKIMLRLSQGFVV